MIFIMFIDNRFNIVWTLLKYPIFTAEYTLPITSVYKFVYKVWISDDNNILEPNGNNFLKYLSEKKHIGDNYIVYNNEKWVVDSMLWFGFI